MYKRILTSVLGIPLLVLIISSGNLLLFFSLIIITSIGLFELYNTFKDINKSLLILNIIISIVLLIIMFKFQAYIVPYLVIIFISEFIYQLISKNPSFLKGLLSFTGIVYITFLIGHLLFFKNLSKGSYFIWLVFISAWSTDTFAYFTGINFGKHKLCPKISPKKSIEGSIGGVVGSVFSCSIYGLYLNNIHNFNITFLNMLILGILSSVIAQFGDLTASLIKRNFGVKDFGNIFPGHGGIIDRFDSIIFVCPIVYYYVKFFIL